MTYRAAVALGSNQGDRLANLRHAVRRLEELGTVEIVSSLYETAPVGGPEQGPYLNAVAVVLTDLEPPVLLARLLQIEREAGRERTQRLGPRTLDLDLITVVDGGGEWLVVAGDDLQVPHPRAHVRRFVLEPLAQVWPEARLQDGVRADDLLAGVDDQHMECLGGDWTRPRRGRAGSLLAGQIVAGAGYLALLTLTGRRPVPLSSLVGGALTAAGATSVTWAVVSLGPAASPLPEPRPGTQLVEAGPYRLVRHPIYSGLVLSALGLAVAARSWPGLAGAAALGAFFSFKARYEESRLRLAVPGYAAYQRRVPGRLLPGTKGPT